MRWSASCGRVSGVYWSGESVMRSGSERVLEYGGDNDESSLHPHPKSATPTHGLYTLLIHLPRRRTIQVGRLGEFEFPSGYYVYTGSAMNGLEARISRHLRKEKRLRWHIDYLLQFAEVAQVQVYPLESLPEPEGTCPIECSLHNSVLKCPAARVLVSGFGSSDCHCLSHLVYFGAEAPDLRVLSAGFDT